MSETIGNPLVFAIESEITVPYEKISQRALGFFVLHIAGKSYGVRSPEATLLACSFDEVKHRASQRGKHVVSFGTTGDAGQIAQAVRAVMYDEDCQDGRYFGLTAVEFSSALVSNEVIWAPDGDEAFDDGSHVLQFDLGNTVRLVAFKQANEWNDVAQSLSEVTVDADHFYGLLEGWWRRFEADWKLRRPSGNLP